MDWSTYIEEMLFPPNAKRTISDEDLIVCDCHWKFLEHYQKVCSFKCIPYLKELRGLIKSSKKRVVANYIGWR